MGSNELVTTFSIPTSKVKVFSFNKESEASEEAARKFCEDNNMKFLGIRILAPYEYHTWQHYAVTVFDVECNPKTNGYWYEFGNKSFSYKST